MQAITDIFLELSKRPDAHGPGGPLVVLVVVVVVVVVGGSGLQLALAVTVTLVGQPIQVGDHGVAWLPSVKVPPVSGSKSSD